MSDNTAVTPEESPSQLRLAADKMIQEPTEDRANPYVGRWNRLVSTTNWEKGRIIFEWREALQASGKPVIDYSDEAWSRLVGHVTSQHVGRLRRVCKRFGHVHQQYESLYWSHFLAALDWSDAEMWLEGAIQNEWSVSQMRGRRWETLGTPADERVEQAAFDAAVDGETLDEDGAEPVARVEQSGQEADDPSMASQPTAQSVPGARGDSGVQDATAADLQEQASDEPVIQAAIGQRLGVACDELPDDLAEAFEQFKLAIIAQRREGWRAISRDGVIECLDALKELVGAS